jgi:hypothetical protein
LHNPDDGISPSEPPVLISTSRLATLNVISPEQSADIVFKAIQEGVFYIFTDDLVKRLFKQRVDNILAGRNPERPQF